MHLRGRYLIKDIKLVINSLIVFILFMNASCIQSDDRVGFVYEQEVGIISWSPKGNSLAFIYRNRSDTGYQTFLYTVDITGQNLRLITDSTSSPFLPLANALHWHFDESKLIIAADGVYSITLDGKVDKIVKDIDKVIDISLSSDMRNAIIVLPNEHFIIDLNTLQQTKLEFESVLFSDMVPQKFAHVSFTPNNNQVYITNLAKDTKNDGIIEYSIIHALGALDTNNLRLNNIKLLKQYKAKDTNDNGILDPEFRLLGWQKPENILYLFGNYFENERELITQNINDNEMKAIKKIPIGQLYPRYVSFDGNQWVYVAGKDNMYPLILISNLNNTDEKIVLNINDRLPRGIKIPYF